MFRKLTAIEPVSLEDWAEEKLHTYAEEVVLSLKMMRRSSGASVIQMRF